MKRSPTGIHPIISVDREASKPLYRQLYEGYRDAIIDRRLRAGQRLPSTRSLARELRVSRIPVLNAFEQLLAEGYLESRVGAGTFVAHSLPEDASASPPRVSDAPPRAGKRVVSREAASATRARPEPWLQGWGSFRVSQPALEYFPLQTWSRLVSRHCRQSTRGLLSYGDPMGYLPFRETLAAYLRTARGIRCEAEQVMVVSGSQQARALSARVLLDPGSPVWVEEPGYPGARELLARSGAHLVPVPVDAEGLDVGAGKARCPDARAVYVTPSHQYPLGVTMSASRRLQLLEWARRSGAWVIEDDYDSEYRYGSLPVPALQCLDRDSRVIYIGSFSKVLFPALRVGYLVVPPDLVPRFARARDVMDLFPPSLYQPVLADFIGEGHFARHLRKMRALYRERRDALVKALDRMLGEYLRVMGDAAGMHLVATLSAGLRDRPLSVRAAERGLWVMPLSACYLGTATRQGLVLGFGGTDAAKMSEAVRRLREAFQP